MNGNLNVNSIPQEIYRYLSVNSNSDCWRILEDLTLPFSNPKFFNDPFDLLPRFDKTVKEFAKKKLMQEYAFSDTPIPFGAIMEQDYVKQKLADIQTRAQLDFPLRFREDVGNSHGLVCFSKTSNNNLMWSHYANNHKGIVIAFHSKHLINTGFFLPVIYSVNRPHAIPDDYKQIWQSKAPEWRYEEEVRLINLIKNLETSPDFPKPFARINELAISKVYIGMMAIDSIENKKQINRLSKILSRKAWSHVDIVQMIPSDTEFILNETQLNRERFFMNNQA